LYHFSNILFEYEVNFNNFKLLAVYVFKLFLNPNKSFQTFFSSLIFILLLINQSIIDY